MKQKLTKLEKYWVLYDVGNSAFTLLVSTIIPIYFKNMAQNMGVSLLTDRHFYTSFSSDLQSGLTLVPLSPEIYSRTYLCYLKHAQLNPTALEMIKYFQEIIS